MNLEIIFDTALNDIPKLNEFIQKELKNIVDKKYEHRYNKYTINHVRKREK